MKLLLVDDDVSVLESMDIILSDHEAFDVVGKANSGIEALEFIKHVTVDIVLMDIQMPGLSGIDTTRLIKALNPEVKVIMLTTFHDYFNIHQSLKAGASGYMLKTDPESKQITTIKMVHEGLSVLSEIALESYHNMHVFNELTPRENDIIMAVAEGLSNKEIGVKLYLSEGTVRNHLSIILSKLELRDRTQLAILYWQHRSQ